MSVIFDSRKAANLYKPEDNETGVAYCSSGFEVGEGEIAQLVLTTHSEEWKNVSFYVQRGVGSLSDGCFKTHGLSKFYHQTYCGNDLGDRYKEVNGVETQHTDYRKSTMILGWDSNNQVVFESHHILTPGTYRLVAFSTDSCAIDKCDRPTIVEVFKTKADFNVTISGVYCE